MKITVNIKKFSVKKIKDKYYRYAFIYFGKCYKNGKLIKTK